MKVYPIERLSLVVDRGVEIEQMPSVQANIDANAGLKNWRANEAGVRGKIAVVGYGPSLLRTWETLREFDTIWTVSGAHDFLVKRGIIPTFHTDFDWRPHKANFITRPQDKVQYVMANTIHPKYMFKLKTYQLSVFQPVRDDSDDMLRLGEYTRVYSPGDVSMQAIWLASMDGYTDIHTFGIDGSHDFDGKIRHGFDRATTHAGPHDGAKSPIRYVTDQHYELYETSKNLIMACDAFCKMLDELPNVVSVTVNSDGLLPAWMEVHEVRRYG